MRSGLWVVFLVAGCAQAPSAPLARQAEAIDLVWRGTYGMAPHDQPAIAWVADAELDCHPDETGAFLGFEAETVFGLDCVAGVSFIEARVARVALRPGDGFSDTALAHELYHFGLAARGADVDAAHAGPAWGRYVALGGETWYERGLVDDAYDALRGAGL
jgi:hypothetical protein